MTVYLLLAVMVQQSLTSPLGPPEITIDHNVFKSLAKCERNRIYNEKELKKVYTKVALSCIKKVVN